MPSSISRCDFLATLGLTAAAAAAASIPSFAFSRHEHDSAQRGARFFVALRSSAANICSEF
ncbi:MAG TPA: hypothetical protein VK699_06415 [Terriglobales bacterium]|jgi:hypothetical protein|nr:hypothetical protein [Terriglobales bacterium]